MIAVDIPRRRVAFHSGMTDQEKYIAVKKAWRYSGVLPAYPFPIKAYRSYPSNEVCIFQPDDFWTIEKDKINGQIIDKVPE